MISLEIVRFEAEDEIRVRQIRTVVFVEEQGVPLELDFDGLDNAALHAVASLDGTPVATGRMLDDGHIGRIAVLKNYRDQGFGSKIVSCLIEEAMDRGFSRVYLGAQKQALGFYSKLGFAPYGEEYMDAGIEHIWMAKSL